MGLFDFLRSAPKKAQRPAPSVQIRSIAQAAQTGRLESSWGVTPTTADGFPHPRGDGPASGGKEPVIDVFSPPAWGWSALALDE